MNIYQYFSISFVIAIAVFIGAYVAKNAEEELKVGSKHIKVMTLIISYVVLFFAVNKFFGNLMMASFIPTVIIAMLFLVPQNIRSYALIIIIGTALSYMLKNDENYIVSSLLFIQMICIGAMSYYLEKKQLIKSITIKAALFLVIMAMAYFV